MRKLLMKEVKIFIPKKTHNMIKNNLNIRAEKLLVSFPYLKNLSQVQYACLTKCYKQICYIFRVKNE